MTHPPSDYDPMDTTTGSTAADTPQYPGTGYAPPPATSTSTGTADVAKGEASQVKDTAVDAGKNVAATAKDEAGNVVAETKAQAQSLLGSVSSEVRGQAGAQQQKVAASVQSLAQELTGMVSGSGESGPLTDLAQQAADKGSEIARWLEDREPSDVLAEVKSFARRRPVTFLVLCGFAGVVAGRLTRGAVAANTRLDSPSTNQEPARRAVESPAPRPVETVRPAALQEGAATPLYDEVLEANPDLAAPAPGYQPVDPGYQPVDPGYRSDPAGGMR